MPQFTLERNSNVRSYHLKCVSNKASLVKSKRVSFSHLTAEVDSLNYLFNVLGLQRMEFQLT